MNQSIDQWLTREEHERNHQEAGETSEQRADTDRQSATNPLQQDRGGDVGGNFDGRQQKHVEEDAAGESTGVQWQRVEHQSVYKPALNTPPLPVAQPAICEMGCVTGA